MNMKSLVNKVLNVIEKKRTPKAVYAVNHRGLDDTLKLHMLNEAGKNAVNVRIQSVVHECVKKLVSSILSQHGPFGEIRPCNAVLRYRADSALSP